MSLFNQFIDRNYNAWDNTLLFWDIMDLVDVLSLSKNTEKEVEEIKSKILHILENTSEKDWTKFKNNFLESKDHINRNSMQTEYYNIKTIKEKLTKNESIAMFWILNTVLNEMVNSYIKHLWLEWETIIISEQVTKIVKWWQNFSFILERVKNNLWHTWVIIFLQELIQGNKHLNQIKDYCEKEMEELSEYKNDFQYWDYSNTLSLLETQQHFKRKQLEFSPVEYRNVSKINESNIDKKEEKNLENWKAFSLSWWLSNAFAQLWYIQQHIENWWTISAISWTSMWSVIWVLVAFIGNDSEGIEKLINIIGTKLRNTTFNKKWNIAHKWDRNIIKEIFTEISKEFWIDDKTKFSESKIPITINASREYNWGEQEIILWWERKVIESVFASINMTKSWLTRKSKVKRSYFWKSEIDWIQMNDFAANERWNPIDSIETLWISHEDVIILDVWYSSEKNKSAGAHFSRYFFKWALRRDVFWKFLVEQKWWTVVDFDTSGSENKNWILYNWDVFQKLINIWKNKYKDVIKKNK